MVPEYVLEGLRAEPECSISAAGGALGCGCFRAASFRRLPMIVLYLYLGDLISKMLYIVIQNNVGNTRNFPVEIRVLFF